MTIELLLLISVAFTSATPMLSLVDNFKHQSELTNMWVDYKRMHDKHYSSIQDETVRRMIWEQNLQIIQRHNLEYDLGMHTYYAGVNQFTDLSNEEYLARLTPLNDFSTTETDSTFLPPANVEAPPPFVNWVNAGYVTPVKNQRQCGSCWAFSATGSLEGQHKRRTGKLVSLSEQQLVDCSRGFGNYGCNGGLPNFSFNYIIANKGIDSEISYPYESVDNKTCRFNSRYIAATATGVVNVLPRGNETMLQSAVAYVGPISICVDATYMQHYRGGIFYEPRCSSTRYNHAVLLVGYGAENGTPYWLIKNSWGTYWGLNGYMKMVRNRNNHCGVATLASYPLV